MGLNRGGIGFVKFHGERGVIPLLQHSLCYWRKVLLKTKPPARYFAQRKKMLAATRRANAAQPAGNRAKIYASLNI